VTIAPSPNQSSDINFCDEKVLYDLINTLSIFFTFGTLQFNMPVLSCTILTKRVEREKHRYIKKKCLPIIGIVGV